MKIEHIALWVKDLEGMKSFYEKYFEAHSNDKYINPSKGFSSYFLTFESGARLELMHKESIAQKDTESLGWTHLAFSTGSKEEVDSLTEQLRNDDLEIVGEPRITGDGYYESVIKDPEGNLIELTI